MRFEGTRKFVPKMLAGWQSAFQGMSKILQKYLPHLRAKKDLASSETVEIFNALRTATDQEVIAKFLDTWAEKGYTSVELATCAKILRENCIKVITKNENFIDIVGTGGSKAKIFNVSTAVAFVAAGAGIPVAKHGNRAASSHTGSADALELLGVNIVAETDLAQKCLDEIGICFMFAPKFHNLTKELAMARRTLGKPTIFNLLGPLANPANAPFQLIGVWKKDFMKPMAEAIAELGTKKTWIVHGEDGLDEITLNGKTFVAEIIGDKVNYFEISPADFGIEDNSLADFKDISAKRSTEIINYILQNGSENQTALNIILINSAAAIYICGVAKNFFKAVQKAKKSISEGVAISKLNNLVKKTNQSQ